MLELSGNNLLATSQQGPSTATDLCLKLLLVFDRLKRSIRKQPSVVVLDDMSAIIENSEKPSPIAQKIRRLLIDTIQRAREEKLPVCWVAAVGDSDQIPAAVHSMAKATTVPPLSLTSRMVLFARMISRAGKHFPLAEQPEEASVGIALALLKASFKLKAVVTLHRSFVEFNWMILTKRSGVNWKRFLSQFYSQPSILHWLVRRLSTFPYWHLVCSTNEKTTTGLACISATGHC